MNTCSRLITAVALVIYALYHVAAQYYSALDSRLLAPSWHGLAALAAYESGEYESASQYWRRHYGMTYDDASVDELREFLEEQVRKEPERIEWNYLLADLYFSQGKPAKAAASYRAALARREKDYDAQLGLATALALQGDYRGANALFASLFMQNSRGRNFAGVLQILSLLDRLERTEGNANADLYLTLANVNRYLRILDARRGNAVLSYADRGIAIDPKLDGAYFCKAVVFMKRAEYGQALEEFAKVVAVNPGNADAYSRMGFIYGRTGNLEKELASYRRAAELGRDNPRFTYNLGQIMWQKYGDFKQAAFYFKQALDLAPHDYDSMFWYGDSLLRLREYDRALEVSAMIRERYPADPSGYKLKADCLMEMKRYEEALRWYALTRERGAGTGLDFHAFSEMGHAYKKLKKPAEAIAVYRQALELKPYDVNTLYNLQYLYRTQGRYDEAYEAVKEILRIKPDHVGARSLVPYLKRNVLRRSGA